MAESVWRVIFKSISVTNRRPNQNILTYILDLQIKRLDDIEEPASQPASQRRVPSLPKTKEKLNKTVKIFYVFKIQIVHCAWRKRRRDKQKFLRELSGNYWDSELQSYKQCWCLGKSYFENLDSETTIWKPWQGLKYKPPSWNSRPKFKAFQNKLCYLQQFLPHCWLSHAFNYYKEFAMSTTNSSKIVTVFQIDRVLYKQTYEK